LGGSGATISAPAAAPATPPGPKVTLPKTPDGDPSLFQKATDYVKNLPSSIAEGLPGTLSTIKDAALQGATAAINTPKALLLDVPKQIVQKNISDESKHEAIQEGLTGQPMSTVQKVADTALRSVFLGGVMDRQDQPRSIKNTLLDILDIGGTIGGLSEVLGPAKAAAAVKVVSNIAKVAPEIGLSADEMNLLGKVAGKLTEEPAAGEALKASMPAAETAPPAAAAAEAPAAAAEAAKPVELPVQPTQVKEGPAHALFSYNDNYSPDGSPRSIYTVFGNPEDPAVKQIGWGSSVTKDKIDAAGIPITGREARTVGKWDPVDLAPSQPASAAGGAEPPGPSVPGEPPSAGGPPAPPAGTPPSATPPPSNGIGQFNIDRFKDPQVRQILENTQKETDVQAQIIAQKRGVISDSMLKDLADKVDLTPQQLQNMAPGTVLNAEGVLRANQTLGGVAKGMANLAEKYKAAKAAGDTAAIASITSDSSELMKPFVDTLVKTRAISSELGRALRQQRIAIDNMSPMARQLIGDAVEGGIQFNQQDIGGILDRIGSLGGDENAISSALTGAVKPSLVDNIVNIATSLKLSSPVTLLRHNLGNALAVITRFGEKSAQGPVDLLRSTFTGTARERFSQEAGGYLFGLGQGMQDGGRAFLARIMETIPEAGGIPAEGLSAHAPPVGGVVGKVLGFPSRILEAGDQFFQTILHRGELYSVALRKAAQEGLQMEDRWNRIQELVTNPTEDMLSAAESVAREYNYKNPLGEATQLLDNLRNTFGGLPKLLVPFFRTPVNVGKFIIQRSPLALTPVPGNRFWAELAQGGGTAVDAATRVALGSAIQAMFVDLSLKGYLTGQGPSGKADRNLLEREGWQPYSFHIGGKYYSYQLFDPLTFGAAADVASAWTTRKEVPTADMVATSALSIIKNLVNQPFLRTVHDVLQSVQDERGAGKFLDSFAGGMVPSGVGLVTKILDPVVRKPEGMLQSVEARIPGLSTKVPPRMDVFGDPVMREQSFPVQTLAEKHDPLNDELSRLNKATGYAVGYKAQRIGPRKLDQDDYVKYQQAVGAGLKEEMTDLINSPRYQNMPDASKVKAFKKIDRNVTEDVEDQMRAGVELKALGLPDISNMGLPPDLAKTLMARMKTRMDTDAYKGKTDPERKDFLKAKMLDVLQNYKGS
jgi:hypothetical protein